MSKHVKRIISVLLAVFSIAFGITWNQTGFCLGDFIFTTLGFPVWSDGNEGIHYPAILAFILLFVSLALFSSTTAHKSKTFRRLLLCLFLLIAVLNILLSLY